MSITFFLQSGSTTNKSEWLGNGFRPVYGPGFRS